MKHLLFGFALALFMLGIMTACTAPRRATPAPGPFKPPSTRPNTGSPAPMDTIRWTTPTNARPPIGSAPAGGIKPQNLGDTYQIAFLLPFLTKQYDGNTVPEKSKPALQFYTGAKIALEQLSQEEGLNLVVDVFDTQASDADFQSLLSDRRFAKASVYIGPFRSSHITIMAEWAKKNRKILVSPDSPNGELTQGNPDFIQMNPSLRAHCRAIAAYIARKFPNDAVTLVCKEKEAGRMEYFQEYNRSVARPPFGAWLIPDETVNFDKFDFKAYFKPGKTAVFVLPTWASQDYVMAFLRRLKAVKGNNKVAVFGMPQWRSYDAIDPEYFNALNVHISQAGWLDYARPEVSAFQQKFYEATGTIPDEDGYNGYDVTLFVGKMLKQYGLSFTDHLPVTGIEMLQALYRFEGKYPQGAAAELPASGPDYWENTGVRMLKYDQFGFWPALD